MLGNAPLRLLFHGPDAAGKRRAAEALAAELGVALIAITMSDLLSGLPEVAANAPPFSGWEARSLARLALREAYLAGALALVDISDASLAALGAAGAETLVDEIGAQPTPPALVLIADTAHSLPRGRDEVAPISIPFPAPDWRARAGMWREALHDAGLALSAEEVERLAGRFNLSMGQIERAVASAQGHSRWWELVEAGEGPQEGLQKGQQAQGEQQEQEEEQMTLLEALFSAARAQTGRDLETLTTRIDPVYGWGDLVLPPDEMSQLREVCSRAARNPYVLDTWGFGRKLSGGKGVSVLFAGPSGTGKTMAAEVIAGELRLGLYRIDLSGVVSKYIGETEKNLDRIFRAAEATSAILFFDEADALFGKRSEVRDSHDRYANIEISYLLQKMEAYEGVTILATNLRGNLDEAFTRRLAFTIHFPFPDEESRLRIWNGVWPAETPLEPGLDLAAMAAAFKLSGGNIRNVALSAAYLAAEEEKQVGLGHLLHALRREYGKMGKLISREELEALVEATA
jgi:SpoVK/Ycf46/Vps4 family AAA+-type ATPase